MADTVYLKKDIAADKPFENHPNLIFGLIFAAAAIFILASLIVLTDYLPTPIVVVIDLAIIAGLIYWIVKKNRKSNLSANEAFVSAKAICIT